MLAMFARTCAREGKGGARACVWARGLCAAGARYGATRPADACGMRTTARPIRRGAAAHACGMRTSGHTQQSVPNRAPMAAEGAQQGAYRRPRATCLIWVAELPAAPRLHNGDCIVGRAPSGRAPAKRPPARS